MNSSKLNLLLRKGFSLVELMIVVAISMILIAIAVPNFQTMLENQRLVTTASEFFSAVNMTRAEAIKRGDRVDMIANDGTSWTSGWTIFIDSNSNQKIDDGETIILTHDVTSKNLTIASKFTDVTTTYISYTGNGRSRTNASTQQPQAGTVSLSLGSAIRRVKINFLGRARICNPTFDLKTCEDDAAGS